MNNFDRQGGGRLDSPSRKTHLNNFEPGFESTNLIDLHVYNLPRNFWLTRQNLAYNETIKEAISSGFIRVEKDLLLWDLRSEISRQCLLEEIPRDYVFLKSVGRTLTRVRPNQEFELKVKHFLPPLSLNGEIFILETDKEIENNSSHLVKFDSPAIFSHQSPDSLLINSNGISLKNGASVAGASSYGTLSLSSVSYNYKNGLLTQAHKTTTPQSLVGRHVPLKSHKSNNLNDLDLDDNLNDLIDRDAYKSNSIKASSKNFSTISSSTHRSIATKNESDAEKQREWERLRDEQERLKRRQLELEALRNKQIEELNKRRIQNEESEKYKSIDNDFTQYLSLNSSNDKKTNHQKENASVVRNSATSNVDSPNKNSNFDNIISSAYRNRINKSDKDLSQHELISSIDQNASVNNSNSLKANKKINYAKIENNSNDFKNQDEESTVLPNQTNNAQRLSSQTQLDSLVRLASSNNDVNVKMIENVEVKNGLLEKTYRINKNDSKPAENEELVGSNDDTNALSKRLKLFKEQRIEMQSMRDDLVKSLKQVHNKLTLRRKEVKDIWKKKYFAEKKRAPELEEKVAQYLNELDSLNAKTFASLELDIKTLSSNTNQEKEAKLNWLNSQKLSAEIYLIQRQIDQAKLKLVTDIKLRSQAEIEAKQLRLELNATRLNLNQLKNNTNS